MGGWKYKSHADLVAAGYVWTGGGHCRAGKCAREILFYRTPDGKHMPIDPGTFEPHHATCVAVNELRQAQRRCVPFPAGPKRQRSLNLEGGPETA